MKPQTHPNFNVRSAFGFLAERAILVALFSSLVFLLDPMIATAYQSDKPIRIGIIGLDTSHSIAFTKLLNEKDPKFQFPRCQVVCAYPYGSADIESSSSRIPGNTETIKELGIEIVDSIESLIAKVDAVLLETNDGRLHLEQAIPVLKAGKPVFIDKPIAASLVDAIVIFSIAKQTGTPMFSSSSLRFASPTLAARKGELVGKVVGCHTYSPATLEPSHPDLFWYGIHGVEQLFTVMGMGCESVVRSNTDNTDVVVGVWKDGRIGTFRGMRSGKTNYGGTVFGEKGQASTGGYQGYQPLVKEIASFFESGKPPVDSKETIEIYAFLSAADLSKENDGGRILIVDVLAAATQAANKRLVELGFQPCEE